ncbi:MAG: hypothetical protein WCJ66_03980 [Verrucomicrobiota bacterium]
MATNLHDPNNHAPPVAADDVWDDGAGWSRQSHDTGAGVLPRKRQRVWQAPTSSESSNTVISGLRINVESVARPTAASSPSLSIKEYGGEVFRLEQPLAEAPFQAAIVIPAMTLSAPQDPSELEGESKDWGKARQHPLRWLVIAGMGVGGVLVAALATQELLLSPKSKTLSNPLELVQEEKVEEMQGFEPDGPCEENARSLLAAYAKATTPEAVLPLIRNSTRLSPRLTQNWHPWLAPAEWFPSRNAAWEVSAEGGVCHGRLSGSKPNFAPYRAYFVREGESLRIDWEATEGISDAPFTSLARGIGAGGVVRCHATPENFYSLTFPEEQYRSYKLLAADLEQVVWGYVKLENPSAAALLKVFEAAKNEDDAPADRPMTLRLAPAPAGAQKNQWIIGELLHIEWVSP